jgi:chitodextrinase
MVVICGQNKYKLDTKHVINGVVVEGTREGEVDGSITNNRVAHEFCAKNAATCTGDFITSTASENRFSLAVLLLILNMLHCVDNYAIRYSA